MKGNNRKIKSSGSTLVEMTNNIGKAFHQHLANNIHFLLVSLKTTCDVEDCFKVLLYI